MLAEMFNTLEEKVLDIIDESTDVKQSVLASKIDSIFENDKKLEDVAKKLNANPNLLSQPTLALIQSGAGIEINKVSLQSSDQNLAQDTIVMNLSAKYKDICAMIARTIFVDPSEKQ